MLYRNLPEFFKTEEKAFLFFTWPQVFLILAGMVVGWLISKQLWVGGALVGLILGVVRVDQVPLYQVIGTFARYWAGRIRSGRPPTVRAADLWPSAGSAQWQNLWIQTAGTPTIQVSEGRRK